MNIDVLTEDNFLLYAARHYDNPHCTTTEEFIEDLNRIKTISRIINKYRKTGEIKITFVLNHVIILINLFGIEPTIRMLYLKCPDDFDVLRPILIFLDSCPDKIVNVKTQNTIYLVDVQLDIHVVEVLRKIRS